MGRGRTKTRSEAPREAASPIPADETPKTPGEHTLEFVARLRRLGPLLAGLETLEPVRSAAPRPGLSPEPPRYRELMEYLVYLLLRPAIEPWFPTGRKPTDPRRVETKVLALLEEGVAPEFCAPLVKASFRDALHHRYRYSSKCRATSTTVTVLATYFWQSQPVQAAHKSSDVYRLIGEIVEQMSTPACFVCDKPHTFKNWRAVRARDQLRKGRWAERGERLRRFISPRSQPSHE